MRYIEAPNCVTCGDAQYVCKGKCIQQEKELYMCDQCGKSGLEKHEVVHMAGEIDFCTDCYEEQEEEEDE